MRAVRALSGVVAGGLFVLMLVIVGAAVIASRRDFPGPGSAAVTWHLVAAAVAIAAQSFSDRRRGGTAILGSVVVFITAGVLLWSQWWG